MISGSTRYARRLGFFGGLGADAQKRTPFERATGLDFSGQWAWMGGDGSGVTAGASPTTLLAGLLGAGLGVVLTKGKFFKGSILGGVAGLVTAAAIRSAPSIGI